MFQAILSPVNGRVAICAASVTEVAVGAFPSVGQFPVRVPGRVAAAVRPDAVGGAHQVKRRFEAVPFHRVRHRRGRRDLRPRRGRQRGDGDNRQRRQQNHGGQSRGDAGKFHFPPPPPAIPKPDMILSSPCAKCAFRFQLLSRPTAGNYSAQPPKIPRFLFGPQKNIFRPFSPSSPRSSVRSINPFPKFPFQLILSGESRNPFRIPTEEWIPAFAGKKLGERIAFITVIADQFCD